MRRGALALLALLAGVRPAQGDDASPGEAWRARAPLIRARTARVVAPVITLDALPNGARVYTVPCPEAATVSVRLVSLAGARLDPPGQEGLGALTLGAMLRGAGGLDEPGLARELARIGAAPGTLVTDGSAQLRLTVLPEHVPRAVELLTSVMARPTLAAAGIARDRERHLAYARQMERNARVRGFSALAEALFGSQHPAARPNLGSALSLARLEDDGVRSFHRRYFRPATTALILAGPIRRAEALAIARGTLGPWQAPAPPGEPSGDDAPAATPLPAIAPSGAAGVAPGERRAGRPIVIAIPGLHQAQVLLGGPGLPPGAPEQAALDALAVTVSQRLHEQLRESMGLTYSIDVNAAAAPGGGMFSIATSVRADAAADAVRQVRLILTGVRAYLTADNPRLEGVAQRAREVVADKTQSRLDTVADLGGGAASLFEGGQPADGMAAYLQQLQALTPAQLSTAAARYLDPAGLQVVIVADPSTLAAQAAAINAL